MDPKYIQIIRDIIMDVSKKTQKIKDMTRNLHGSPKLCRLPAQVKKTDLVM